MFRKVENAFWQDDFTLELDFKERYFFLWLLTNPKTNQSGCYVIVKAFAMLETGLQWGEIKALLDKFQDENKIKFDPNTNEILILNWMKYNGSSSGKVLKNVAENIQNIKNEEFKRYCIDTVSIRYGYDIKLEKYSMDTQSQEEREKEEEKEKEKYEEREKECASAPLPVKSKKFIPPTLEEVKAYATENNALFIAEKFYRHFTAGEPYWVDSKGVKVKNWKQKFQTWISHGSQTQSSKSKVLTKNNYGGLR